jgi:hypothetical protein
MQILPGGLIRALDARELVGMKMNRIAYVAAVIVFVFVPVYGQTQSGRRLVSSEEILNVQIDGCTDVDNNPISFNNVSMREFLINVHWCSQMPMGAVLLPDNVAKRYDFKPRSLKLKDVLESIAAAEPRYRWSVEDGVINLVPRVGYPALLDIPIGEFRVENSRIEFMFANLEAMPEVRRRAEELGLHYREKMYVSLLGRANLSLDCKNSNVRGVLNAVAQLRNTLWFYQEYEYEGKRYYSFG